MIEHGAAELQALAELCRCSDKSDHAGWLVDEWVLGQAEVELVSRVYEATLMGDVDEEWNEALAELGLPLDHLLLDADHAKDDVTRADAVELAAVAALIAVDEWPTDLLEMPNSPKRSRAKSDSGLDAMTAVLKRDGQGQLLGPEERLYVASVKHSISTDPGDIRRKLVASLDTASALTTPYMVRELRVFSRKLREAGYSPAQARRVYLFLRGWPDFDHVTFHAAAGLDVEVAPNFHGQLRSLPTVKSGSHHLRVLHFPNISALHLECP